MRPWPRTSTASCSALRNTLLAIHSFLQENPDFPVEYIEVAEPWWEPHAKFHRAPWFLCYLAWARNARKIGSELVKNRQIDLAVHATYSTYWLPSPAVGLGIPSLWGPVGGGVTTPRPLRSLYSLGGLFDEWFDYLAVRCMAALPATRRTWHDATVRVVQNLQTLDRLPRSLRSETRTLNHTSLIRPPKKPACPTKSNNKTLIFPSRLEARKGPSLALRAVAQDPTLELRDG